MIIIPGRLLWWSFQLNHLWWRSESCCSWLGTFFYAASSILDFGALHTAAYTSNQGSSRAHALSFASGASSYSKCHACCFENDNWKALDLHVKLVAYSNSISFSHAVHQMHHEVNSPSGFKGKDVMDMGQPNSQPTQRPISCKGKEILLLQRCRPALPWLFKSKWCNFKLWGLRQIYIWPIPLWKFIDLSSGRQWFAQDSWIDFFDG